MAERLMRRSFYRSGKSIDEGITEANYRVADWLSTVKLDKLLAENYEFGARVYTRAKWGFETILGTSNKAIPTSSPELGGALDGENGPSEPGSDVIKRAEIDARIFRTREALDALMKSIKNDPPPKKRINLQAVEMWVEAKLQRGEIELHMIAPRQRVTRTEDAPAGPSPISGVNEGPRDVAPEPDARDLSGPAVTVRGLASIFGIKFSDVQSSLKMCRIEAPRRLAELDFNAQAIQDLVGCLSPEKGRPGRNDG